MTSTKSEVLWKCNCCFFLEAIINMPKGFSTSPECSGNPVVPGFGTTDYYVSSPSARVERNAGKC
jgi:hypothetical protein